VRPVPPVPADAPAERLAAVRRRIERAAASAGRDPAQLVLVAVSKNHPPSAVAALAALGQRDFGESRHQEAAPKAAAAPELRWHFLGRLQRNKARAVAHWAEVVHSLDRAELVVPLARGAEEAGRVLEVFVQVSLDGDTGRGGVPVSGAASLADQVAAEPALRLLGVMAVAPQGAPARPAFAALRTVGEAVRQAHPEAVSLSAGMSGDLEDAVAEGATHLRVGTALFGARA